MSEPKWYQREVKEVFKELETGSSGLAAGEAKTRLGKYGFNEITLKGRGTLARLLDQMKSPLVWILLVAATVTTVMSALGLEDMWADTAVILGVVLLNVVLGFYQEGKAEAALEALKKMAVQNCTVIRDGVEQIVPARELVPGDVVVLNGGDKVPADIRLYFTRDAYADEAPLTGESTPVTKTAEALPGRDLAPGDQHCMAFSGTFITRGTARGVVVATAEQTEFGKIAQLMKATHVISTPLQRKIAVFTRTLVIAIIGLGRSTS